MRVTSDIQDNLMICGEWALACHLSNLGAASGDYCEPPENEGMGPERSRGVFRDEVVRYLSFNLISVSGSLA